MLYFQQNSWEFYSPYIMLASRESNTLHSVYSVLTNSQHSSLWSALFFHVTISVVTRAYLSPAIDWCSKFSSFYEVQNFHWKYNGNSNCCSLSTWDKSTGLSWFLTKMLSAINKNITFPILIFIVYKIK